MGVTFDRIVGLGLSVMDHVYRVDELDGSSERTRYHERLVSPGGMVGTALSQAALLGCRCQLITGVGDDAEGRALTRELRNRGIGTRAVARGPEPTGVALVLVRKRDGERRFVVADRRRLERSAPRFDLSSIRRGTLLLVDGHYPTQAMRAVRQARERGVSVVADFSDARPEFVKLLRWIDTPIVPMEFVKSWGMGGPRDTLRALRDRTGGAPVVTLGERGALALWKGRFRRIPARRVRVRDTTGAGDVFHGAFAAGLYHGRDFLDSLALAAYAAGGNCTALGGTGRLMTLAEMEGRRFRA